MRTQQRSDSAANLARARACANAALDERLVKEHHLEDFSEPGRSRLLEDLRSEHFRRLSLKRKRHREYGLKDSS